ncbi:hypothetical protein JCM10212_000594 [Sporobolomyces blumeae]
MLRSYTDVERTPPSRPLRCSYSGYSSDEASEDDHDIPRTPGDVGAPDSRSFTVVTSSPLSRVNRGERDPFLEAKGGLSISNGRDADDAWSISPRANVFYPSFGDFLPSVKRQEERGKSQGLGLEALIPFADERIASEKVDSLSRSLETQLGLRSSKDMTDHDDPETDEGKVVQLASPMTGIAVFAPFSSLSPNTDSFTFCPTPTWHERGRQEEDGKKATTTSAALRSPELKQAPPSLPMKRAVSTTPPSTPVRPNLLVAAPQMQQSRSLPIPTYTSGASPFAAPSPTRPSFAPSIGPPPSSLPPYALLSSPSSTLPRDTTPRSVARPAGYPLSPADTERIAKLHNGRIPTLEQLCPPDHVNSASQQPIVNTGNQGPMVVQAGDWRCGTCSFVNWRRRKICLRCFPFANDIGNILTIQSQRAAHLAGPVMPSSAPAHQTTFGLASPTRSRFDPPSPGFANGMERSSSYPPYLNAGCKRYPQGPASPYTQPYLFVPASASPTRSTFNSVPPSPTRYHHSSPLSANSGLAPMPGPGGHVQFAAGRQDPTSRGQAMSTVSSTADILSVNLGTTSDLAVRRSERVGATLGSPPRNLQLNLSSSNASPPRSHALQLPVPDSTSSGQVRQFGEQQLMHSPTMQRSFVDFQPRSPTYLFHHHGPPPRSLAAPTPPQGGHGFAQAEL